MINLNDCKFGDNLRTRNGNMVIYVGRKPKCLLHFLVADVAKFGYVMLYANDNGEMPYYLDGSEDYDIIGRWEE